MVVKKTIIGSVFMLAGVIINMSIIITAAVYASNITSWSGPKPISWSTIVYLLEVN